MYHSFLIHSSADGHLGGFHVHYIICLYYKQCCDEHWGTCVSFYSGFLDVYAQQWDCWVISQFYLQFFKESPHCLNNFTICVETQKTLNSQSNREKKNGTGEINFPDFGLYYYTTKLQSSRQYGTGTKTEI